MRSRKGMKHRKQAYQGRRGAKSDRSRDTQTSLVGVVSAHPEGFGFVDVPGRDKGLFLPREEMRQLMHGDKVEVRTVQRRGRESAELVRIIEQAPAVLTGQFAIHGGAGLVEARSRKFPQPILVRERDAEGAHDGDWVRIEIKRGEGALRGRVLEVLGDVLEPVRLIDLIVAEQQLPYEFPNAVLAEADAMPERVKKKDQDGRMDLTHLPFVTIDGEDARDFDDAICVLPRGDGFEAWVAIADVAHYVRPGMAMDGEALERANSFYFPDRVIPMLPEKLSNGLCSLNPDVDRLAMAVRMRFDVGGRRRSIHVYEAVIHSKARLTYTQASRWLEERDNDSIENTVVRTMLDDSTRLFRMLERHRSRRGTLDLDVPEVRAVLHEGRVADMNVRDRNIAHHLIEEMMLAANTAVAEYLESHKCALLYRVHAPPERQAIESLNEFLEPFGLFVKLPKLKDKGSHVRPADVQRVLEQSEDKPFAHVLHRLVLRSMQQAKYTPVNEGHFGLAFKTYCHFTSPIRRYADLTVHRRLKALLQGDNPDAVQPAEGLGAIGEKTSTQERKQQRAEWDTQAMLAALYHKKDIGQTMPARISGLTKRRIFFELEPTTAEGSMAIDDLGGMYWLDEKNHRLVAKHGGHAFNLGDQLDVVIDSTDPVRGLINISLA
ncbi:MAG: ribonuclease R [Mariprofundaceae bacterium]